MLQLMSLMGRPYHSCKLRTTSTVLESRKGQNKGNTEGHSPGNENIKAKIKNLVAETFLVGAITELSNWSEMYKTMRDNISFEQHRTSCYSSHFLSEHILANWISLSFMSLSSKFNIADYYIVLKKVSQMFSQVFTKEKKT